MVERRNDIMPNSSSYIRRSLFLVAVLLFSSCSSDVKPTKNLSASSVDLQLLMSVMYVMVIIPHVQIVQVLLMVML